MLNFPVRVRAYTVPDFQGVILQDSGQLGDGYVLQILAYSAENSPPGQPLTAYLKVIPEISLAAGTPTFTFFLRGSTYSSAYLTVYNNEVVYAIDFPAPLAPGTYPGRADVLINGFVYSSAARSLTVAQILGPLSATFALTGPLVNEEGVPVVNPPFSVTGNRLFSDITVVPGTTNLSNLDTNAYSGVLAHTAVANTTYTATIIPENGAAVQRQSSLSFLPPCYYGASSFNSLVIDNTAAATVLAGQKVLLAAPNTSFPLSLGTPRTVFFAVPENYPLITFRIAGGLSAVWPSFVLALQTSVSRLASYRVYYSPFELQGNFTFVTTQADEEI